jgi:hypothetical protein
LDQLVWEKVSASSFETRRVARATRTVLRMRPLLLTQNDAERPRALILPILELAQRESVMIGRYD